MITEHGVYKAASDILPLFDISLCSVQKNISAPMSFTASEYLFLYLIKGSGRLSLYNKTHNVSSGEFVICRPFESKTFVPEKQDDSEFYAVSFQGRYGADLLSNLNLIPKKNYFVGIDTEIISSLDKVLDESAKSDQQTAEQEKYRKGGIRARVIDPAVEGVDQGVEREHGARQSEHDHVREVTPPHHRRG